VKPPEHWEADAVLTDGGVVHIRPIRPDDAERLRRFHAELSTDTIYNRFFMILSTLSDRDVERFTVVDHDARVALVAVLGDDLVGVVRYDRLQSGDRYTDEAEVAFVVADAHQGRGLGPLLLEHLAEAARERGIRRFVAETLPNNRRMLNVFASAGYRIQRQYDDGVVSVEFPLAPTEESVAVARAREQRAEARSVARLLRPESVAVIGASRVPGSVGAGLVDSMLEAGYLGRLSAVNPAVAEAGESLAGLPTFASVTEVPEHVDLAVVVVAPAAVPGVVRDCAAAGVGGLLVVTGLGERGSEAERELLELARGGGMRVLGPDSLGVLNTDPEVRLDVSLAPVRSLPGRVGFASHAGPLAVSVLQAAAARGLGLSSVVSLGARVDVSGNDLLQFWDEDERTEVVALHLESFGNPRKFSRLARRAGRRQPVVVLASGVARSRTSDALFRQAGVIRVDSLSQLYDVACLLACQPLPAGRRVAVVGTSRSLATLAEDSLLALGLTVGNRTDLPFDVAPAELSRAVVAAAADADAVLALVVPPYGSDGSDLAGVLPGAAAEAGGEVPVVAVWLGVEGIPAPLQAYATPQEELVDGCPPRGSVPSFASPDAAAAALALASRHAAWRARPEGTLPLLPDVQPVRARQALEVLRAGRSQEGPLGPGPAREILAAYGVSVVPYATVSDLQEATASAGRLGYPVALKVAGGPLKHRVEGGGVRLDVEDETSLRRAWAAMAATLGPAMLPAVVQPMAASGVPMRVGLETDPAFGPIVTLGIGGIVRDVAPDRPARIVPLTDTDAAGLVSDVPGAALLTGDMGGPVLDTEALVDLILRVSRLALDLPELLSLELDPVVVSALGVSVLSATGRLGVARPDLDSGPRRLPRAVS
jgi:acyl-CoA synthetase (NDP forming)/RimJ/RimL family protein N-acetyltransferase